MKKSIAMDGALMVFQDDFGLPQFGKREVIDDKASAATRAPQSSTDVDGYAVWQVLARQ